MFPVEIPIYISDGSISLQNSFVAGLDGQRIAWNPERSPETTNGFNQSSFSVLKKHQCLVVKLLNSRVLQYDPATPQRRSVVPVARAPRAAPYRAEAALGTLHSQPGRKKTMGLNRGEPIKLLVQSIQNWGLILFNNISSSKDSVSTVQTAIEVRVFAKGSEGKIEGQAANIGILWAANIGKISRKPWGVWSRE